MGWYLDDSNETRGGENQEKGKRYERQVAEHLREHHYDVIHNVRSSHRTHPHQIDFIAQDRRTQTIYIVEAKGWDYKVGSDVIEEIVDRMKYDGLDVPNALLFHSKGLTSEALRKIEECKPLYNIEPRSLRYKATIGEKLKNVRRSVIRFDK